MCIQCASLHTVCCVSTHTNLRVFICVSVYRLMYMHMYKYVYSVRVYTQGVLSIVSIHKISVCLCTRKEKDVCVYTQGHNVCPYKVTECVCRHSRHSVCLYTRALSVESAVCVYTQGLWVLCCRHSVYLYTQCTYKVCAQCVCRHSKHSVCLYTRAQSSECFCSVCTHKGSGCCAVDTVRVYTLQCVYRVRVQCVCRHIRLSVCVYTQDLSVECLQCVSIHKTHPVTLYSHTLWPCV